MRKEIPAGGVCSPKGFSATGGTAGIKESGKPDLALLVSAQPARAFAVFTQNLVAAAPVQFDRAIMAQGNRISAILVNSGNANAVTGDEGLRAAERMAAAVQKSMGFPDGSVMVSSTGVIGRRLPIEKIEAAVPTVSKLVRPEGSIEFAESIMTTDTRRKTIAVEFDTERGPVRIGGACKGAGMIHPNMATMLAYITTDLEVPPDFADEFRATADETFNAISVDGDTSTNDTCILLANGAVGFSYRDLGITDQAEFRRALLHVMRELSVMIVRDGEGATRTVEIRVEGARTRKHAMEMARFVSRSPLVKTAMHGGDPNWGRYLSSAGSSGQELDLRRVDLNFEGLCVLQAGTPQPVDMVALNEVVKRKEYKVVLDLHLGESSGSAWTCDLSYDYVKINADYTT